MAGTEIDRKNENSGRELSRLDRCVIKLIALGIVAFGFAVAWAAPWPAGPFGIPTVLVGVAVFAYPDPQEHLKLYRRIRGGPEPPKTPEPPAPLPPAPPTWLPPA